MYEIHGHVEPGFESVRDLFEENFIKGRESNAQCCVYVDGIKVIDLWGNVSNHQGYDGDSLQNVFSSTKSIASIAIATLVDQGRLNYSDSVSKYWPEFRGGNKEQITVADVLRHESGLNLLNQSLKVDDLQTTNIKKHNSIGKILETEVAEWPQNQQESKRVYHSWTRGWILNELFRRIHPEGLTIGEFVRNRMLRQSNIDVHIGFESSDSPDFERIVDLECWSISYVISQSILPSLMTKRLGFNAVQLLKIVKQARKNFINIKTPSSDQRQPSLDIWEKKISVDQIKYVFNKKEVRTGEIPSANGSCSARGLAKLAAFMANKGELNGDRLISEETWEQLHGEIAEAYDVALGNYTSFSQGGINKFKPDSRNTLEANKVAELRKGYYGWMGFGGSVFQWYPELKIGFGYIPTNLFWFDINNTKAAELQKEVVKCVCKLKE